MLVEIDATHLLCPMPLLKAKQALRHYPHADGVAVTVAQASAVRDFQVFAEHAGLQLVCEQREAQMVLTLSKRKP